MKDQFGNAKPVQIDPQEWWFNGNFIQKQVHPLLPPFIVWKDNDEFSYFVTPFLSFKEAVKHALLNGCANPDHKPTDFL